jgi:hypothetical protein
MWHRLNRILDHALSHVDAHIRNGRTYDYLERIYYISPQHVEQEFTGEFGATISDDYFSKVEEVESRIVRFLNDCHNNQHIFTSGRMKIAEFRTEVIKLELACKRRCFYIQSVVVRPCAERCGFYKRMLHCILTTIKGFTDLDRFIVQQSAETNIEILTRMGFDRNENDMLLTRQQLENYPIWEVNRDPPTAAELNSEEFVNRTFS